MYEIYKPFRNYLRGFNMWSGFGATYSYMQYLQFRKPLPNQLSTPATRLNASQIDAGIFEFELEILTRELILNSEIRGGKPFNSAHLAFKAFGMIRRLEDVKWGSDPSTSNFVTQQLSRIIFKQVPWQTPYTSGIFARYYMLYSHPRVAPILEAEFGITAIEFFQVVCLLAEEMMHQPMPSFAFLQAAEFSIVDPILALSDRISRSASDLRKITLGHQSYDVNWAYTFNPLRKYPLVYADNSRSTMCPAPPILLQRLTDGVYFDLMNADSGRFGNAIGTAFEDYVGAVAKAISESHFVICPEARWGRSEKRSVDWIIADQDATLFVECKLARLDIASQSEIGPEPPFREAIRRLAQYIGQLYATLADGLDGEYPHWKPDNRPIFPILVTFHNWFVFGPFFYKNLDRSVADEFAKRSLDLALQTRYPFTVCSIDEFEGLLTACREQGIHKVLAKKNAPEHRQSVMQGFLANTYPGCFRDGKSAIKSRFDEVINGPSRLTKT